MFKIRNEVMEGAWPMYWETKSQEGYRRKRQSAKRHAIKRAYERHNLRLTFQDLKAIRALIRTGKSVAIFDGRTLSRCRHKVFYQEKELVVVYSNKLKTIVTVLPANSSEVVFCETCEQPRGGNPECSVCWDEHRQESLKKIKELIDNQVDSPPEFSKIVTDHF